jgi:hypothetical protein
LAARLASQARQEALAPYRPYHTHDKKQPLKPARWSSSTSRSGRPRSSCRRATASRCTIRGKDYEYGGASGGRLSNFKNELRGCGPFLHDDPRDRPAEIFGGDRPALRPGTAAYLLLPVIPPKPARLPARAPPARLPNPARKGSGAARQPETSARDVREAHMAQVEIVNRSR